MNTRRCECCGNVTPHFYGIGTHDRLCMGCGGGQMNIHKKPPLELGDHFCSKCGSVQPFANAERGSYVRCKTCRTLFLSVIDKPLEKTRTANA